MEAFLYRLFHHFVFVNLQCFLLLMRVQNLKNYGFNFGCWYICFAVVAVVVVVAIVVVVVSIVGNLEIITLLV
jgi:hypothetical protein